MKVLFLNHNQEGFGTFHRCFFLGRYLARLGIDVTMVCASGKRFDLRIRKRKIEKNFTVVTLPRIKYHTYFTGQLLRLFLTIPIVLFWNYDILHAFTVAQPQIGIPALLAKWVRKKPLVVDWDDLWGGGFGLEHPSVVGKVFYFFERFVPKYADRITYVSEFLGGEIKKLGLMNNAVKISNGANIDEVKVIEKGKAIKQLGLDPSYKHIVSVGNTYFAGGLRVLFQAVEQIMSKDTAVRLLMVGYTDILPDVRSLYEKIKTDIVLTGTVPFSKVLLYMSAADVLVLPMEDNPIENARFPIRFGDYLAAGKPIVSNACGEVKNILETYVCGLISKPNDDRAFANNMSKIFSNNTLASVLSKSARRIAVHKMSWTKLVKKLNGIYKELRYDKI